MSSSRSDQGIIDKEQYESERPHRAQLPQEVARRHPALRLRKPISFDIYEAWKNFFDSTEEDGGTGPLVLPRLVGLAVMTAGMQQASEYMQASLGT